MSHDSNFIAGGNSVERNFSSGTRCILRAAPPRTLVSLLVRVKDELSAVRALWASVERQTIFDRVEIVILDGGSTDGTLEFFQGKACNLYALVDKFNYGRSCNQLAELANSPYLVFLSGHVLLEQEDALECIIAALKAAPDAAIYLRQVPNTVLGFNAYEAANLARRFPAGDTLVQKSEPEGFSNAASAIPRAAWQRQPFQEVHGSEDFLWAKEHLAKGGKVLYMPQVSAMHSHNESADQIHRRVRLSAVTRGQTRAYAKAGYMLLGVYVSMRRVGAGNREALRFAWAHASAYF